MIGNLNDRLALTENGDVDAAGWLQWDPGDQSAAIVAAISQGTIAGHGSGVSVHPGQTTWSTKVVPPSGARFVEGPATAQVTARVTDARGESELSWVRQVSLDSDMPPIETRKRPR